MWLDDLFPKARFLDALEMVEKAGHKKRLLAAREEWIDEGKPKTRTEDDNDEEATTQPQEQSTTQPRPTTPPAGDVPDEDDLYDATPRPAPRPPAAGPTDDMPDDDELDALMAEYGGPGDAPPAPNPQPRRQTPASEDNDDDLEFLMAESERQDKPAASEVDVRKGQGTRGAASTTRPTAEEEEMEGLWD
jgi:replication fork protection complex subunit Csm3/Swi3